jgi:hypothetical protein
LKSGLAGNTYNGNITVASTGAEIRTVSLTGTVTNTTGIDVLTSSQATIVSREYYTVNGQRVSKVENLRGIFIIKNLMSDGSIIVTKIFK